MFMWVSGGDSRSVPMTSRVSVLNHFAVDILECLFFHCNHSYDRKLLLSRDQMTNSNFCI